MGDSKSAAVAALAILIKQIEFGEILPEEISVCYGHEEDFPDNHTGWREFKTTNDRRFIFKYRVSSGGGSDS